MNVPRIRGRSIGSGRTVAATSALVALLALPSAVTPAAVAAAPSCTVAQLPTLGGLHGSALAVSSAGLVVGYAEDGAGVPQPVIWRDGQATRIGTGLIDVTPAGVNSRGEVVGTGVEPGSHEEVGWHWAGGRTTELQAPRGTIAVPSAISDSGQIVGALAADDDGAANPTAGEAPERAATWSSSVAPATPLPALPGDVGGHAYGVNSAGVVVGNSQGDDHFTPVTWTSTGRVLELPTPASDWGIARSVDEAGLVVGDYAPASGDTRSITWDAGRRERSHGPAGGRQAQGRGLLAGRAVGQTVVRGPSGVDRPRAVLWDDAAGDQALPVLAGDAGSGVTAAAGGTRNTAVGFSSDARQTRRPVVWGCAA